MHGRELGSAGTDQPSGAFAPPIRALAVAPSMEKGSDPGSRRLELLRSQKLNTAVVQSRDPIAMLYDGGSSHSRIEKRMQMNAETAYRDREAAI